MFSVLLLLLNSLLCSYYISKPHRSTISLIECKYEYELSNAELKILKKEIIQNDTISCYYSIAKGQWIYEKADIEKLLKK